MKAILRFGLVAVISLLAGGCSLLEVKLESGIEPLPQEQLNMRLLSRDFSNAFYAQVEQGADRIAAATHEVGLKSNSLMWKINSEQALQRSIFQASPVAAMVDTWVFSAQMAQFYETGAGSTLFKGEQDIAIDVSNKLYVQFERTIKGFAKADNFEKNRRFIKQYVASHPITDLTFVRQSAFGDWLAYNEISELEAVTTFGSVPEVMSDISDRMAMIAEQMPKILAWKAELYALHANINAEEIQKTLMRIGDTSAKFQELMGQSPEMMQALAVDMRIELAPLLEHLSATAETSLSQLSVERQALEQMLSNERIALEEMVARERAAGALELDRLSKHTIERVFTELTKTLKNLILYFVIFLLAVFFAPLGLGVWLGKRMQAKKQQGLSQS